MKKLKIGDVVFCSSSPPSAIYKGIIVRIVKDTAAVNINGNRYDVRKKRLYRSLNLCIRKTLIQARELGIKTNTVKLKKSLVKNAT